MALIDELKERWENTLSQAHAAECHSIELYAAAEDLSRAIAALEPPAQPVHPDELRTVPGAVEEVRDQLLTAFEDDHIVERAPLMDAQTCEEVDPHVSWQADAGDGDTYLDPALLSTEPEVDPEDVINDLVHDLVGDITFTADTVGVQTYMDGDQFVIREISAEEMYAPPSTDLWQQGYDDRKNGFEPSLAEDEYTKGYEARALIEREHSETMERAKFFEGGMMADADRHARDQTIMEKAGEALAAIFKREREDA